MKSPLLVAVAALCALTVGGCASSPTPTAAASLSGRDTCAALSGAQLARLKLASAGDPNTDSAPDSGCSFNAVDPNDPGLGLTYALGAHDDSADSATGTRVLTVGHHKAYETTVPDVDQCEVDIAVGKDLAMIVGTGTGTGTGTGSGSGTGAGGATTPECALAEQAAHMLEPALP
jgi:hypothetical protein